MNIIVLMLKCLRKNGMVRMNSVLDICEIDMMIVGYFIVISFW